MADAASSSTTTDIILSDPAPAGDADFTAPPAEAAPPGDQTETEAKPGEEKPDGDKLILGLLTKSRQLAAREKAFAKREAGIKELETRAAKAAEYDALFANAKGDPGALLTKMAEAAGLDVDDVVTWYTDRKSGGAGVLPADHQQKALAQEVADLKAKLEEKETGRRKQEEDAANNAALENHLSTLKQEASDATKFPLFNTDPGEHAIAAIDLMIAFNEASRSGQTTADGRPIRPITHAEAVRRIEDQLRADTEKKAPALGYQRPASNNETRPTTTQTPATAPRAVAATAAPFETASPIRSDEEIRADWARSFGQH